MFALLTLAMVQNVQIINSRCCNIIFFKYFVVVVVPDVVVAAAFASISSMFSFSVAILLFLPLVLPFCAFVWASEWQWCIVNELSMLQQQYSKTAVAEIKCGKNAKFLWVKVELVSSPTKKRNGQAKTPKKVRICHEPKWTELLLNGIITKN